MFRVLWRIQSNGVMHHEPIFFDVLTLALPSSVLIQSMSECCPPMIEVLGRRFSVCLTVLLLGWDPFPHNGSSFPGDHAVAHLRTCCFTFPWRPGVWIIKRGTYGSRAGGGRRRRLVTRDDEACGYSSPRTWSPWTRKPAGGLLVAVSASAAAARLTVSSDIVVL